MSEFTLILVLRKENKQNSDMTWQRYKLNLRNSLLLEEYFRVMEQFDSILSSVIDSTLRISLLIWWTISRFIRHFAFLASVGENRWTSFSYCDSLENVSFPPALKNILEIVLLSQWKVVLLRSYMIVEYYNLKTNYKIRQNNLQYHWKNYII